MRVKEIMTEPKDIENASRETAKKRLIEIRTERQENQERILSQTLDT